jgi:hypothetical protein
MRITEAKAAEKITAVGNLIDLFMTPPIFNESADVETR